MKFKTTIQQFGNNTGIELSEKQLEELGGGNRPLVTVTLNGYTYRGAVGSMKGRYLISLSAANRKNANVQGGDTLEVEVVLDTAPRTVEIPPDLQEALSGKSLETAFDKLAPSRKKAFVNSILDAKTEETRQRRIDKVIDFLT
ncbi:YdeI/OmpD-associated family protein [Flavilitoribacter nigricans]|uniref:DUF1905 domain-containing protein n=1 Tax=Flavilitoribacter nigricans (strain ATCC 23147 / DSM 23189 / NBRC 102662 / NCIMB 1420 / SS-2) TaxID=1122177 RepID=A0A2D0N2D5_FLAN2|nr:YdeI/OmpD-associated family protein [Flavilitoribacter nigricans]PHN02556.1 hypothetical protein CRP01_31770 [Flavilitoribacter nigricans DSM 23189 = NBRC 102662]